MLCMGGSGVLLYMTSVVYIKYQQSMTTHVWQTDLKHCYTALALVELNEENVSFRHILERNTTILSAIDYNSIIVGSVPTDCDFNP